MIWKMSAIPRAILRFLKCSAIFLRRLFQARGNRIRVEAGHETFRSAKDRLLVTVYHDDEPAAQLWKKIAGFSDDKIIRINTDANFWRMGDAGPCGPCSEIFIDHGDKIPGGRPAAADEDGDRFLEFWNLVFMQYEEQPGGGRINLPRPSIDTGMGLDRMSAILQGVANVFDNDLFKVLRGSLAELVKDNPEGS